MKKLGSGSFGQVYEAYWRSALVAVKIVNLEEADMSCNLNCALARFKCTPCCTLLGSQHHW